MKVPRSALIILLVALGIGIFSQTKAQITSNAKMIPISNEDLEFIKQEEGVFVEGETYNIIIDGHGTGLRPLTEEQLEDIRGEIRLIQSYEYRAAAPVSSDNSSLPWFPPIGDQANEGSCVAWATGYYTKTFQEAREHGWDLSGATWTAGAPTVSYQDNIFSPEFIYHQGNGGTDDGMTYFDALHLLENIGCCTWVRMPYSDTDHTSWPDLPAWREAPLYRSATGFAMMYTQTDPGIENLKQMLADENLATISINAYQYANLSTEDLWTADDYIGTTRNHANTIVGYDDNYGPYTEGGETRYGAFKVANSWGVGSWENVPDGFYYISYECMKQDIDYIYFYDNLLGYEPTMLAVYNIDHPVRDDCRISFGVGGTGSPNEVKYLNDDQYYKGGDHPFPSNDMALDISEFQPFYSAPSDILFEDVFDFGSVGGQLNSFSVEIYDDYESGIPIETLTAPGLPIPTQQGTDVYAIIQTGADPDIYVQPTSFTVYEISGDILGDWTVNYDWGCNGVDGSITITFFDNFTFSTSSGGEGTWSLLSANTIEWVYISGTTYTGIITGSHIEGTMVSSTGSTGCFTADKIVTAQEGTVSQLDPQGLDDAGFTKEEREEFLQGQQENQEPSGSGIEILQAIAGDLTIRNVGGGTLTVTDITDDRNWLSTTGYSVPIDIVSGNSIQITVDVDWDLVPDPSDIGTITITSDDLDEPTLDVQVTAYTTTADPDIEVQPTSITVYENSSLGDILGDWTVNFDWDCDDITPGTTTITFFDDYTFTTLTGGVGTWSLTGNIIEWVYTTGTTYTGTVTGNYIEGTMFNSTGRTGCFTADKNVAAQEGMLSQNDPQGLDDEGFTKEEREEFLQGQQKNQEPSVPGIEILQATAGFFTIRNVGGGTLTVTDITDDRNWLSTTGYSLPIVIEGGNSIPITVDVDWDLVPEPSDIGTITITSDDQDEPTVDVQVTAIPNGNQPPVADADLDLMYSECYPVAVQLHGLGSYDPNGDPITYLWTEPPGITLSDPTSATPTFDIPPNPDASYEFTLVVNDGELDSDPDTVVIFINRKPVADAGPDQTESEGETVQLDGFSGSYDPDGDPMSYLWTPPAGITLSDPTSATPTFDVPQNPAASYEFTLVVNDGSCDSDPDTVVIFTGCSPDWTVVTYTNSTTAYGIVTLDGATPASAGDLVGAFVDGECRAISECVIDASTAYVTLLIQGEVEEQAEFRIWDASECTEIYEAYCANTNPGGNIGYPPDFLQIGTGEGCVVEQTLPVASGWNLISLYVHPDDMSPGSIFSPMSCLEQVKSMTESYDPDLPDFLNTLEFLTDGSGYFVNASCPEDVIIIGQPVDGTVITIDLSVGWNLIGYPFGTPTDVDVAFASLISASCLDQVKSMTESYDPDLPDFLNTLETLEPGKGYFINMTCDVSFEYPAPVSAMLKSAEAGSIQSPWNTRMYTQSMVHYGKVTLDGFPINGNAVVGAFVNDECRGQDAVRSAGGETYTTLVINGEEVEDVTFKLFLEGKVYTSRTLAVNNPGEVTRELSSIEFGTDNNISIFPNPVEENLTIEYNLNRHSQVNISILDILGRTVYRYQETNEAGSYSIILEDVKANYNMTKGTYIMKFSIDESLTTHKILIQ